ncbi:hypothetical protein OEA41_000367 [Lepraria neglecta]|uniref:Uncharacterized protein n=1 Tax=Lepraria neglecta TaxID=209136 RepID=A0AAD9ZG42_9LECA|nr:hypothetical protein OEA41_000367 [Lepraria neglecta]
MANPHLEAVWAKLLYLAPSPLYERSKPYYIAGVQPAETKQTNKTFAPRKTEIINARGNEGNFSIDENGFECVDYPLESAIESTDDRQRYMRDMEDFFKGCLKAEHVYAYDCVRPLVDIVEIQPLAICDSISLHEKDLIACDETYPHVTTEIFHVLHNPDQRWYYLREQKREEVLLMRN